MRFAKFATSLEQGQDKVVIAGAGCHCGRRLSLRTRSAIQWWGGTGSRIKSGMTNWAPGRQTGRRDDKLGAGTTNWAPGRQTGRPGRQSGRPGRPMPVRSEFHRAGRVAPQSPTRQSTMPALDTSVGRQPSNSADISSAIGGITRPVSAARPGPCRFARLK